MFSDVSRDLLEICEVAASDLDLTERCRFAVASADDLTVIGRSSVDVVMTRSVLIYVKDKARAFEEFYRVLRPGGRNSLFEPINRMGMQVSRSWRGDTSCLVEPLVSRVRAVFERTQPLGTDPMLDFDERDLIRLAERAGFAEVRLQLFVEITSQRPGSWESFLRTVANPKVPSLGEAIEDALDPAERDELAARTSSTG